MIVTIEDITQEYIPQRVNIQVEHEWEHRELISGLIFLRKHRANSTTDDFLEAILARLQEKL